MTAVFDHPATCPRAGRTLDAARWLRWSALWCVPPALFLPLKALSNASSPTPLTATCLLIESALEAALWIAATPVLLRILARVPIGWPPTGQAIALHAGAAAALALANGVAHALGAQLLQQLLQPDRPMSSALQTAAVELLYRGPINVLLYAIAVAGITGWRAVRREHARERDLVQARLDALASQLAPHMVFNALNAISEVVYRDAARADEALCRLARVMRSLAATPQAMRPLREERDATLAFVAFHEVLLGNGLRVVVDIPDTLLSAAVPAHVLQPLVENAIRHGAARDGVLEVHIAARAQGASLELAVRNRVGPGGGRTGGAGIGLARTRQRLDTVYGAEARLQVHFPPGGTGVASLHLPFASDARA